MKSLLGSKDIFHEVVHDLRSPLTSIFGLAEVFLKVLSSNLNEKQKDIVRRIMTHSQFALDLVGDILDIENIASGKLVVQRKNVSLRAYLEETLHTHLITATDKGIRIDLNIHSDISVPIDERRLKQVINNLLSNAIKFSKSDTKIVVYTDQHEDSFYIKIKDQGPGIRDEERDKLFTPFAQISNKPTANERSTGLGLSIVKNMVEVLGGNIYVESKFGHGSTFIVKMPLNAPLMEAVKE